MVIEQNAGHPSSEKIVRILIADDHPLFRQALRMTLEKETDFKVVGEASNGQEAIDLTTSTTPDIVIMDVSMPVINGFEGTRQIKKINPSVAVLVLTVHDDDEHILELLSAGAAGYMAKSAFGNEVVAAVRGILAGEAVLSPVILKKVTERLGHNPLETSSKQIVDKLSARELQVLRMTARGMANKDIALELGISVRTVKGYLSEILSKMRVGSRTEAVVSAIKYGLISVRDLS